MIMQEPRCHYICVFSQKFERNQQWNRSSSDNVNTTFSTDKTKSNKLNKKKGSNLMRSNTRDPKQVGKKGQSSYDFYSK